MLIVLLEMLVPSGKLKKMISLVTGFILIITIINPILGFLKKGDELKDIQIAQTTFLEQKELEASAGNLTKKQSAIILSTYKSKMIKDVEENVIALGKVSEVKADVIVEENPDSKEFGRIKRIVVNLKQKQECFNSVKPVIAIKNIKLGENVNNETLEEKNEISKALGDEVRSKLCKLYNVNLEQIAVGGL